MNNNIFDIEYLLNTAKEIRSVNPKDIISAVIEKEKHSIVLSPTHKISIVNTLIDYREKIFKNVMLEWYGSDEEFIKIIKEDNQILMAYGLIDEIENLNIESGKTYEELFNKTMADPILQHLEDAYDDEDIGYFTDEEIEYLKLYFNLHTKEEKRIIDYLGIEENAFTNEQLNRILSSAKEIEERIKGMNNVQYCFTADTHLYKGYDWYYPILLQDDRFTIFVENAAIFHKADESAIKKDFF